MQIIRVEKEFVRHIDLHGREAGNSDKIFYVQRGTGYSLNRMLGRMTHTAVCFIQPRKVCMPSLMTSQP